MTSACIWLGVFALSGKAIPMSKLGIANNAQRDTNEYRTLHRQTPALRTRALKSMAHTSKTLEALMKLSSINFCLRLKEKRPLFELHGKTGEGC